MKLRTKRALVHVRRARRFAGKHLAYVTPRAHHWRWGGFVTAALLAAAVFFVIGAGLRLFMGPVSLGPLSGQLQTAIGNALPGLAVRYDEAALEWTRDEGRLNLVILGARVFDEEQRIIAQAPKAEIVLAATPFLKGKVEIKRIALVGVQLTMVRTADGRLRLGMEQEQGESDVLEDIRRAIANNSQGASSLQSFAVRKARLAFYDQGTGVFVVAPDAALEISTRNTKNKTGPVVAGIDAQIEISGHRAHVVGSMKLPENSNGDVNGDFSVTGLDINALGSNAKAFSYLEPYVLKADLTGSFTLANGTHLSYADFGLGAAGTINGLGEPVHVKALRLVGRYDGRTGRLLIDDGTLAGNEARAHLTGTGDLSFTDDKLSKADLDLTMDKIEINMHSVAAKAVTLDRIALRGEYTPADHKFAISEFLVRGGPLSAELTGGVTFVKDETPEIDLDGHVSPLSIEQVMHYWPLQLGGGARDWIAENILTGRIGPVQIQTRIPAGALQQETLPESALDIRVSLAGGTINYIDGMTPITDAQATGVLSGDSFTGELSSGKVGALNVSGGHAVIHNLHAHTAFGDFTAHAEGQVPDMLALIDEKPLQYPTRFHMRTDGAKGTGSVDLAFKVPLLRSLKVDDLDINVKGEMRDLTLAITDKLKVTNGTADFTVDNDKLHMSGDVNLSDAKLNVDWTEVFNTKNPVTSTILVKGTLDDDSRTALNFHTGGILDGPVGVTATLTGHRGTIRQAQMTMDLTPAVLSLDLVNYKKPAGVSAGAQMNAQFDDTGSLSSGDIELKGAGGFSAKGSATFGDGAKLEHVSLPYVHAGPNNDFALEMTDTAQSGFDLSITGHSADGTGLGRHDFGNQDEPKPAKPSTAPFHIAAHLDRVMMREGVTISALALDTAGAGDRPQSFSLSGNIGKSGALNASLGTNNGVRQIKFSATDAGQLIKGLFGFGSIHGGSINMTANLSPPEKVAPGKPPVDYSGSIVMKDVKVTNQPFLARLFSAVSFGGLFDLLRGQGIGVDKMEIPFRMHGGVLDIHDASATGPSLGMSADGYIDRRSDKIALEGAIAPLSGVNSILGAIPLVGDVLVSKKGEGVIGVSYKISGDADQPEISMNPLSVFTPGIFRRIFEGTPRAPAEANTTAAPKTDPKGK